jgi:hypothetical protein
MKKISEDCINVNFIAISLIYVFGFLIRPESFLLGSAATLPIIVFIVLKNKKIIKKEFKSIITSVLLYSILYSINVTIAEKK